MKSKHPSGVQIHRKDRKYTISWTKGEAYAYGQRLVYGYKQVVTKKGKSTTVTHTSDEKKLGSGAKSYTVTISADNVTEVFAKVKGKGKYRKNNRDHEKSWSEWESGSIKLSAPPAPKLATEIIASNQTKFTFTAEDAERRPYDGIKWETVRKSDCGKNYKADSIWKNATGGTITKTSGTVYNTAEAGLSGSMTRLVRAQAYGQAGASDWTYAYYVYAKPNKAVIDEENSDVTFNGEDYDAIITWTVDAPKMSRPIDEVVIQAQVGVPTSGMGLPSGSWTDVDTYKNTSNNRWEGKLGSALNADECLFYRVMLKHDSRTEVSDHVIVPGVLATPSALSTNPVSATHTIEVSATNASQVPDSKLAVKYYDFETNEEMTVDIIESDTVQPVNVVVPEWTTQVGDLWVYAFVGTYYQKATLDSGVKSYVINNERMHSMYKTAASFSAPVLSVTKVDSETAGVSWTWPTVWNGYDPKISSIELSWAERPDAWDGTGQPSTYTVARSHASQWNVNGLDEGIWYFRARLMSGDGDNTVYSAYSEIQTLDLTEAPSAPLLELSRTVVKQGDTVTLSWKHEGTQKSALIAEKVGASYNTLATVGSETEYDIDTSIYLTGTSHAYAVQVCNNYGVFSPWSDTVADTVILSIADPLTCEITSSSLVNTDVEINPETYTGSPAVFNSGDSENIRDITKCEVEIEPSVDGVSSVDVTIADDDDDPTESETYTQALGTTVYGGSYDFVSGKLTDSYGVTTDLTPQTILAYEGVNYASSTNGAVTVRTAEVAENQNVLETMPLTLTVAGAGTNGYTTVKVVRTEDYPIERPDGTDRVSYENQTIVTKIQQGDPTSFTLDLNSLIGKMDDNCHYALIATVEDDLGQTDEDRIDFVVAWAQQAVYAAGTVTKQDDVAYITPTKPAGAANTDTVDIYRLSCDKPVLIYKGAQFNEVIVDPYPTIGDMGGYRLVLITKNGDYITADGIPSWTDYSLGLETLDQYIDFDGERLPLHYDVELDDQNKKIFQAVRYLGGSVQGYYIEGYEATGTVTADLLYEMDPDDYRTARELMFAPKLCHVRTKNGANYVANVEVHDKTGYSTGGRVHGMDFSITRVDDPELDGVTLDAWEVEE